MQEKAFHILTVGWEPSFIEYFARPIERRTGIAFTHALVGNPLRLRHLRRSFPEIPCIALSQLDNEPLPEPDFELLASLESVGAPTIRSMLQGDRVLANRGERASLGYATLLARRLQQTLTEVQPDVVLGSFDSLHSTLSLAVSKSLGIPWVALAYPVIPNNLTGFCMGITPDTLLPIGRANKDALRSQAREIIRATRGDRQQILAYRPPKSLAQRTKQALAYFEHSRRRAMSPEALGYDSFTWPTATERALDVMRRSINELRFPARQMLRSPPKARYAYFPLHMAPESSIDTWATFYQDQLAFVFQVSLALPADLEFVVKIHFGDPDNYSRQQLLRLMKLPRLRIARPDAPGHLFLKQADLVLGIQGTASLEAALLGKPVLLFGDSPYQHFPRTERAKRPDELYEQIRRMLALPPPTDDEILEAFTAYMARYMPGRINDWQRAISEEELAKLADCFRALRAYVGDPANRRNWYEAPPSPASNP